VAIESLPGFVSTWTLLHDVLPGACAAGLTAEAIRTAALAADVPAGASLLAGGLRLAPASASNAGQNLRALAAMHQWQQGRLEVVFPAGLATAPLVGITR
jgi:hypothetical protein